MFIRLSVTAEMSASAPAGMSGGDIHVLLRGWSHQPYCGLGVAPLAPPTASYCGLAAPLGGGGDLLVQRRRQVGRLRDGRVWHACTAKELSRKLSSERQTPNSKLQASNSKHEAVPFSASVHNV